MIRRAALLLALAACASAPEPPPAPVPHVAKSACDMDVRRLLADELALRPAAEPQDLYVLVRGAILGEPPPRPDLLAAALGELEASAAEPLIEDLDEVQGTVRLNLRKWRFVRGTADELWPVVAASTPIPDPERLEACLAAAPAALESLGGDGGALEAYLAARREEAWPQVAHSEKYRKNYRPAYRVVLRRHLPPWVTAPPPSTG